jgi:adenine-specific DNA-methyltransferase
MTQMTINDIRDEKKKKGIFYTPADATKILSDWAIRSSDDHILEPSFGGCGFLAASISRLSQLQCNDPENKIFGSDIDLEAFSFLHLLLPNHDLSHQFLQADFLSLRPDSFSVNEFDAIIGNPPYIAHHNMTEEQKIAARSVIKNRNVKLSFRASLWAYFIVHSISFLKIGGRAAWILPSSLLHADYAADLYTILRSSFQRSVLFFLEERLFITEGTEERTAVLLCDNHDKSTAKGSLRTGFAHNLAELQTLIESWDAGLWNGQDLNERTNIALIQGNSLSAYQKICELPYVTSFDAIAQFKIGIVTGANKFFIINQQQAAEAGLPDDVLQYILAKFKDFQGSNLTSTDLEKAKEQGIACLLIDTSQVEDLSGALQEYLDRFPEDKRSKVATFRKRKIWHQPNDKHIPDAFFPYMQQHGPFLLLNSAQVNSTNTIHRVYFKNHINIDYKRVAAISLLSTFSQLSAELEGRSYGSGVLKFELAEAGRIKLLLPPDLSPEHINKVFLQVDQLKRSNKHKEAQCLADEFVLQVLSSEKRHHYIAELASTLLSLRSVRHRSDKTKSD